MLDASCWMFDAGNEVRMKFRKLRIAFSITCLVACALLMALWVRSYWRMDQVYGHTSATQLLHFGSMRAQVTVRRVKNYRGTGIRLNWLPESEPVSDILQRRQQKFPDGQGDLLVYRYGSRYGFGWLHDGVYVPHWFLALIMGTVAAILLIPWSLRFSLRTLLIAMTLVAIVLGMIAIAMRKPPNNVPATQILSRDR